MSFFSSLAMVATIFCAFKKISILLKIALFDWVSYKMEKEFISHLIAITSWRNNNEKEWILHVWMSEKK